MLPYKQIVLLLIHSLILLNVRVTTDPISEPNSSNSPDSLMLVNTLDGKLHLINRRTGAISWTKSMGSKADRWISLDLKTGDTIQFSSLDQVQQCPRQLEPSKKDSNPYSAEDVLEKILGVGQTQYNLLLRDLSGIARLNITYHTLAPQTEEDWQATKLQHIATTQPGLITFDGRQLLWNLPLTSPVVGLYSVKCPAASGKPSSTHQACSASSLSNTTPCVLQRIAFTTYALDLPLDRVWPPEILFKQLEKKFNESLDLALSLLVGQTASSPLYAMPCVAEASLPLRRIRRTPEPLRLEGPSDSPPSPSPDDTSASNGTMNDLIWHWLLGLYSLPPTQLNRWTTLNQIPMWARLPRLRQLSDDTTGLSVIVPPVYGLDEEGGSFIQPVYPIGWDQKKAKGWSLLRSFLRVPTFPAMWVWAMTVCVLSILLLYAVIQIYRQWLLLRQRSVEVADAGFLPVYFDLPDVNGWAGCTGREAGQPEDIRFNTKHVLGNGANGTMVFEGSFGSHRTAVKRIVRQSQLEKHWRREHTILLHNQHPNLVRCYWTGSTANFHYLVMQRCDASLADVLQTSTDQKGERGQQLLEWNLNATQVIRQIMLGVAYLHRNRIVHRDLKPSNILLVANTTKSESLVVVGDFGISRPLPVGRHDLTNSFEPRLAISRHKDDVAGSSVGYRRSTMPSGDVQLRPLAPDLVSGDPTSLGVAYGTLGWMAPELCDPQPGHLTYAVDIFSCGLLAYHLMTDGEHPFDAAITSTNTGSRDDSCCSSNSLTSGGGANQLKSTSTSTPNVSSSEGPAPTSRLKRHHARQLGIAENHTPSLARLTQNTDNMATACLSRQLIQQMLTPDASMRLTAEEVLAYPLFWSPGKTMRFISELSDLLDLREDVIDKALESTTDSVVSTEDRYVTQRQWLLNDIEQFRHLIFDDHWFGRLDTDIVLNLMSTRGYQDDSGINLLRAIRNKRHHFWHLKEHVRTLLGASHDGMSDYWTKRFPSLVPLLYALARYHLTGFTAMSAFLPPSGVGRRPACVEEVMSHWWRSTFENNHTEDQSENVTSSQNTGSFGWKSRPLRQFATCVSTVPWVRGNVLSIPKSPDEAVVEMEEPENTKEVADPESGEFLPAFRAKPRRRPNQAKKMRPQKRKSSYSAALTSTVTEKVG